MFGQVEREAQCLHPTPSRVRGGCPAAVPPGQVRLEVVRLERGMPVVCVPSSQVDMLQQLCLHRDPNALPVKLVLCLVLWAEL